MNTRGEYYEIQRFNQPLMWVLLACSTGGMVVLNVIMFHRQLIKGERFGDTPMSDEGLLIYIFFSTILMIAIVLLFLKARLEIRVSRHGIHYRYFPIIRNWKYIDRGSIMKWEVKKYFSVGHGLRLGFRFLTIKIRGNVGLELTLAGKPNIRLGTQRPEELRNAMEKLINRREE